MEPLALRRNRPSSRWICPSQPDAIAIQAVSLPHQRRGLFVRDAQQVCSGDFVQSRQSILLLTMQLGFGEPNEIRRMVAQCDTTFAVRLVLRVRYDRSRSRFRLRPVELASDNVSRVPSASQSKPRCGLRSLFRPYHAFLIGSPMPEPSKNCFQAGEHPANRLVFQRRLPVPGPAEANRFGSSLATDHIARTRNRKSQKLDMVHWQVLRLPLSLTCTSKHRQTGLARLLFASLSKQSFRPNASRFFSCGKGGLD